MKRTRVLVSVTRRATSGGSFPGFGFNDVHRACSSGFALLCLCLVTLGAVVSNTSRDFEP